jgi:hypothetical protein
MESSRGPTASLCRHYARASISFPVAAANSGNVVNARGLGHDWLVLLLIANKEEKEERKRTRVRGRVEGL